VDDQKIFAFVETVYRAHFHTIGVFAVNAVLTYYERHILSSPGVFILYSAKG
jgi:hypothetical protein